MKVLVVGEAPTRSGATPFTGGTGRHLSSLMGVEDCRRVVATVNLNGRPVPSGEWDRSAAAAAFAALDLTGFTYVVLAGRRVAAAASVPYAWPYLTRVTQFDDPPLNTLFGAALYVLPHPSGLNRWYNDPENRRRAEKFLRRITKGVDDVSPNTEGHGEDLRRRRRDGGGPRGAGQSRSSRDRRPASHEDNPGRATAGGLRLRSLRPHQVNALDYARGRDGIALFMKMRLGKTLVAIRWAESEGRDLSRLVVAPQTVLHQWSDELRLEGLAGVRLEGPTKKKVKTLQESDAPWVLVNPEGIAAGGKELFRERSWGTIIVDESTCIANPRNKLTKELCSSRRWGSVARRAVLAGTPAPESIEQYVSQMIFINGLFMGHQTYWTWRLRYMQPAGFGWEVKPSKVKEIREAVAAESFVLDAKTAGFFAKRVHEVRKIRMESNVRRMYREVEKTWALDDRLSTRNSLVVATWMRQFCAGARQDMAGRRNRKHDEIAALVTGELSEDRVVIWYNFNDEAESIERSLKAVGRPVLRIGGETPAGDRGVLIDRWRGDKRRRPILVQLKCGRFGLNLSDGTAAIFASNDWSCLTREQALARLDMPGVERPALNIDVVYEDSIEEDVLEALREGIADSSAFLRRVMELSSRRSR